MSQKPERVGAGQRYAYKYAKALGGVALALLYDYLLLLLQPSHGPGRTYAPLCSHLIPQAHSLHAPVDGAH